MTALSDPYLEDGQGLVTEGKKILILIRKIDR